MKKNKLDIFIPVGGLGRRLGGITKKTPKPLIKINNEPFLVKLIRSFNNLDYDNIYLLTNYKEKAFFFLKYQFRNLDLIKDKKRKGTFKSLFDCKKYIKNDFLYSNSDEILDFSITTASRCSVPLDIVYIDPIEFDKKFRYLINLRSQAKL